MAKKKVGDLFLDVSANVAQIQKDMNAINTRVKSSSDKWTKWMNTAKGAVAGFITVQAIRQVASFSKGLIDQADAAAKTGKAFDLSTGKLTEWQYAASLSGASNEQLNIGIKMLAKNLADFDRGAGEAKVVFEELGIEATGANGKLKTLQEALPEIADKFAGMRDKVKKAAYAQKLFGESGTKLIPFLDRGSAGIERLGEEARKVGAVIDEDFAKASEDLNDSLTTMGAVVSGAGRGIVSELAPAVTTIVRSFTEAARQGGLVSASIAGIRKALNVAFGGEQLPTFQDELAAAADKVNMAREALDESEKQSRRMREAMARLREEIQKGEKGGALYYSRWNTLRRLQSESIPKIRELKERTRELAEAEAELAKKRRESLAAARAQREADAAAARAAELERVRKAIAEEEKKPNALNEEASKARESAIAKELEDEAARKEKLVESLMDWKKTRVQLLTEQYEEEKYLLAGNLEAQRILKEKYEKDVADASKKGKEKESRFTFAHFKTLSTMTELFAKKGTKVQRAASATNAVISAFEAANKTMASLPFPANMVAAGVTLAAGIKNAKSILSADGATSGTVSAPAATPQEQAPQEQAPQNVMNFTGNFFGFDAQAQYEVFKAQLRKDHANDQNTQLVFS